MMETLSDEWVRARKQHRCELCGEPIEVGDRHRRWTGKDGGDSFEEWMLVAKGGIVELAKTYGESSSK